MPKTQAKRGMSPRELDALRKRYVSEQKQADSASKWQLANDIVSGINDIVGRGVIAPILGMPGDINQAIYDAGAFVNNKIKDVEVATGMVKQPRYVRPTQGNAYLGSEDIGNRMQQAGLVSSERRPMTELAASLVSPSAVAKTAINAPKTAMNMLRMAENLEAPSRGVRNAQGMYIPRGQMGAIENLYHGSPHTFDRFDLSKIGTGEGAQAYGYGAYLAESPDVAKGYAVNLANRDVGNFGRLNAHANAKRLAQIAGDNPEYAADDIRFVLETNPEHDQKELLTNTLRYLESGDYAKPLDNAGTMYQARLAWPDAAREATDPLSPENFLDWDKPLSQQTVKDKVVQAFKARGFDDWQIESMLNRGITGEQANVYLGGINGSETGAKSLLDAGIPGIRYLDAGSRPTNIVDKELYALYEKYGDVNKAVDEMMKGVYNTPKVKQQMRDGYIKQLNTQKQTSNYVVFDDKLIDIVSRNNQPIKK